MMDFYPNERLAIFIDGANLYGTAKALGFDIDYKRLLAIFRTKGQLVRALRNAILDLGVRSRQVAPSRLAGAQRARQVLVDDPPGERQEQQDHWRHDIQRNDIDVQPQIA